MKERIFKWLDKTFPIDRFKDNLIDISEYDDWEWGYKYIVEDVFGVTDITFDHWVKDRCGRFYGLKISSKSSWYNQNGVLHRNKNKPAVIYNKPFSTEYYVNGFRINPLEKKLKYKNNRLIRPKYF